MVLNSDGPLKNCPSCSRPVTGMSLFPMSFREIDEARKNSQSLANANRGKNRKRKGAPGQISDIDTVNGVYVSDRRTGRWTTEEMAYCDKLIAKFESGELPISSGLKLNEFLGNMLKSKQSRLTKKMKNAKLSSRTFQRCAPGIMDNNEVREFSELEDLFFQSIQCQQERAEIKFHMQREWREQFSLYCSSVSQPLDADSWLSSVEEMDRRSSHAKDAARMAKRKLMMGFALRTDSMNPCNGVIIEKTPSDQRIALGTHGIENDIDEQKEILQLLTEEANQIGTTDINGKSSLLHSAPFLAKAVVYLKRHDVPFEHVELWVPSFVPQANGQTADGAASNCRLCFAGSATVDEVVEEGSKTKKPLSQQSQFSLQAFGDYSQKFSFDVGCGLPGRVYESGRPTWEQSVQNAPHHHFERCGGALQWGIKTVLGIPIASPNVGRIVVTLYSLHDRPKDQDLVGRLSEEFTRVSHHVFQFRFSCLSIPNDKISLTRIIDCSLFALQLLPSPKWKLVVDIGEPPPQPQQVGSTGTGSSADMNGVDKGSETVKDDTGRDPRIDDVVSLLGELMPSDPNSPLAPYLSGFMSLRLLLLRSSRSPEEEDRARTMLDSYTSYSQGARSKADIGIMLARDYMFLSQSNGATNNTIQQPQQQHPIQLQQQQANFFNLGQGSSATLSGNSLEFDVHNSPMLGPISANDTLSIISN
ncbi:unnamed protein product [Pseudo-nitzschia multistriata]|uniref:Transcription factor MYC/MYB N-terminal domain-containing protein n=1 Tax=Pseudo-nitzschia multistriata TaxID=183589 RepID=A0A448Z639_9STRA|nr:unnamed protein product [Pseudo-nitzschia multistriata]